MDYFECLREGGTVEDIWNYLGFRHYKKGKVKNMGAVKIRWDDDKIVKKSLRFGDLNANDAFRIVTGKAVYIKVVPGNSGLRFDLNSQYRGQTGAMLEVATGKIFPPTNSNVELVSVTVNIEIPKPHIYD